MEVLRHKDALSKSLVILSFGLYALSLILIVGCASNAVHQSLQSELSQAAPFTIISETLPKSDAASDSIAQTESQLIEAMLAQAEYFCVSELYSQADSLLKEVITLINGDDQNSPQTPKSDGKAEFFNAVLGIYADLMPPEYLTKELSLQIERQKVLESIDSITISDEDTILPAILKSLAETKFDVPIAFNERVQKACMYYLRSNRGTIKKWIERSSLYIPIMRKMFADSGLPLDLVYLPLIESGFNPKAYSRAHASGIWQFIPSTGKVYGLRNNYWLDERRDPLKATSSAIRYLKKLYNDFGHWHLALAAYNCGEGGLARTIKKAGVADYWQLKLPRETMNYVPLYLASLIIVKNVERFGFVSNDSFSAMRFNTISVSDCIDMNEIAHGIGTNKDTLRLMNPHILHWCTPPDISNVNLYVPEGTSETFQQFYSSVPDEKKVKWYRYKIVSGDNLLTIAKKFNVPVEAIKTVNRIESNRIIAGRSMFIPIPVHRATPQIAEASATTVKKTRKPAHSTTGTEIKYKVKKGDTLWGIAQLFSVKVEDIYASNNLSTGGTIKVGDILLLPNQKVSSNVASTSFNPKVLLYEVKRGDNLWRIAVNFGIPVEHLYSINDLTPDSVLMPGDIIKVSKAKEL